MINEKAETTLKEIIEQLGNKSYPYIEVRYKWKESGKESDIFAGACSYDNKTGQLTSIDGDLYSLNDRYVGWKEWVDDDYLESGEKQMILTVWEEIK